MLQKATKAKQKRFAAIVFMAILGLLPCCVSPEAVKTDVQGIRNEMQSLEKIVEQKADSHVIADCIDEVNNRIKQVAQVAEEMTAWKQNIEAETINYNGAGWVIIGTGVVVLIFVGAGLLLVRAFMKRGSLLTLLTCAIQKVGKTSPETVSAIKRQLKIETSNGGPFTEDDRKSLGDFAKKAGTFAEQD